MATKIGGASSISAQPPQPSRRRNWPLILGGWIVAGVVLVAIAGPWLAPHDPLARTAAVQMGDRWVGPPYPPLTAGFLLGSDQAGRDLFSRLLWAVQPTLLLVIVIALVRLVVGMAVGLLAGYAGGTFQRIVDGLIRVALLFPVLVVALAVIAFVGIQRGLLAFILGLSLTGWAETARYVETQARTIKRELYVESARSMGAGDAHLLVYHVLRHVLPLGAMLLAFEVSGTLMATASLGFLGYYIGGGAWITVEDWVARRAAGVPELGQMLATSFEVLLRPWPMVVTGGVVMLIVLGVTLLGEGLRRQLQGELELRPSLLDRTLNWTAGLLSRPDAARAGRSRMRWLWGMAVLLLAGVVLVAVMFMNRPAAPAPAGFSLVPPGGHAWATQRHDAFGTQASPEPGPAAATVIWQFAHPEGFATAPVVGSDGTVYVVDMAGDLLAIDAQGDLRWRMPLGVTPVGAPAIGPDGAIYVVDAGPGLSAIAADGTVLWRYTPAAEGRRATSGPIVGVDGTIYFSRVDRVQAVNPDGSERWLSAPVEGLWEEPPRLSPTYALVFLGLGALSTEDGALVDLQLPISQEMLFTGPRLAVGANGRHYLMAGNTALEWELVQGKAQVSRSITWDVGGLNIFVPSDSGISADNFMWLFYGQSFSTARIAWIDGNSRLLTNIEAALRDTRLVGIDPAGDAYLCSRIGKARCLQFDRSTGAIGWDMTMPDGLGVAGGALAPGRLYVSTGDGFLYALGDAAAGESGDDRS
ncbi:MAG: PQQ-binding-like beta-propeller repeat protein [Caldilinea sp.]|nr:PQQ-binding-like beta-propeller repeat protein [Caldilinea sp.]